MGLVQLSLKDTRPYLPGQWINLQPERKIDKNLRLIVELPTRGRKSTKLALVICARTVVSVSMYVNIFEGTWSQYFKRSESIFKSKKFNGLLTTAELDYGQFLEVLERNSV